LKTVQESHGHRHSLIQHKHRYSHLRKFTYIIDPDPDPVDGFPGHKPSNNIRFLHPISFLRPGITSIPDDLALEARDCATLYQAMAVESKDLSLAALEPIKFFEKLRGKLLQQQDIIQYEEALKKKLSEWMKAKDVHQPSGLIQRVVRRLSDLDVGSEEAEKPLKKPDLFYSNLLNFLADLNASGDLVRLLLWDLPSSSLHVHILARTTLQLRSIYC
jgi:ATP-dependent RNA helicase DDX60